MTGGLRYCQTALDVCRDNCPLATEQPMVFAVYSSHRSDVRDEITVALASLNGQAGVQWVSWEDVPEIEDNLLFCEICRHIRCARALLVELTDLNFNVVFEYGYAIGLSKKIYPVVNSSFDFRKIDRFLHPMVGVGMGS